MIHEVYRFYNVAGLLLYVGLTSRGAIRWAQHASTLDGSDALRDWPASQPPTRRYSAPNGAQAMTDRVEALSAALTEPRLFFGGLTYHVHISHEWGALYCKDCGAWCADDPAALERCTGPKWAWVQWRDAIDQGWVV